MMGLKDIFIFILSIILECVPLFSLMNIKHFTVDKNKLLKNNFPDFGLQLIDQTNYIKSYGQVFKKYVLLY